MTAFLEKTLALIEGDNEILKLKAELNKQQEQMKRITVQKHAETSALQNQSQHLKFKWQQQQQYYANMFINGPPVFPNTTYPIPTVHLIRAP